MNTQFTGPFGDLMKRHLQLRRSLGYALRADELTLNQFDTYVAETFPGIETVTRSMVAGYLETTTHLHCCTRQAQLSTLRQFCQQF